MFAFKWCNYGNGQLTKQYKQRKHYYQSCSHPIATNLKKQNFKIKYDFLNSPHHPRFKSKNNKYKLQVLICLFAFSVLDFEIDFSLNKILVKFCCIPVFNCLLCLITQSRNNTMLVNIKLPRNVKKKLKIILAMLLL